MNTDFQDALSSVGEVAIFAWSLLELLFTRILPLVGFLTGHLLLQFGGLLSSVVTTPAAVSRSRSRSRSGRSRPRASTEYSYSWEEPQAVEEELIEVGNDVYAVKNVEHIWGVPQAEEVAQQLEAEEEDLKVPGVVKEEEADDHQNSSAESLKSSDEEHEKISPRKSDEKAPIRLPSIAEDEAELAATSAEAGLETSAPPATPSNDPGNEELTRSSNDVRVAESSPSDVQKVDLPPHADKANKPVAGVPEEHVSSKAEGSAGKIDERPSDRRASVEATRAAEMRKMSGGGGAEMRKSRSSRGSISILRVLPPSLSQMERILRQRSRRVSVAQH